MTPFPIKALLRCKATAILRGIVKIGPEFDREVYVVGHMDTPADEYHNGVCSTEMWRAGDGRWSYDGKRTNRLDIVGFVNPNGTAKPLTNELQFP